MTTTPVRIGQVYLDNEWPFGYVRIAAIEPPGVICEPVVNGRPESGSATRIRLDRLTSRFELAEDVTDAHAEERRG